MSAYDWRAEYEREVRERDRLMAEVKRRGLFDDYLKLEIENEGWDGEASFQAAALQRLLARKPRKTAAGFAARFTGSCGNCRGRIVPGQYIEKGRNGYGYRHTECPA